MNRPEIESDFPRDCLTPVAGALFVSLGMVAVIVWLNFADRPVTPRLMSNASLISQSGQIAKAGEWVTAPAGARVCRLRSPIYQGMSLAASMCTDWQGEIPTFGQQVPWLRRGPSGSGQIMIEGEWRP